MKRRLKQLLGALAYTTGVHRTVLADRAVIALFHRVDDRLRGNPITCTTDEFRAYCDFFTRYFKVISLADLLAKLARREPVGGHLVITFDDGYKDNAAFAAVELERRGLPACFFVATGFIGSNHVPWWDAERSITPEWMSWDDVRGLRDRGFEIGAHTVNHVDLGAVDAEEAEREIVGSRRQLAEQLGEDVPYFSFPYGRRENVTETNRELVRSAGFECCLSAYGGTVRPAADLFDLRREPLSPWYLSAYQFGFELLLQGSPFRATSPYDA